MNPQAQPMQDILDIAGNIHSPWPDRLMILGILAAVALCVTAGYFSWKWAKAKFAKDKSVVTPADVVAFSQLKSLKASKDGALDRGYLRLTEVFKTYVTNHLDVDLADKTREEIHVLAANLQAFFSEKERAQILELFDRAEGIKFAKQGAARDEFLSDVNVVEAWVQTSAEIQKQKVVKES